MSFFGTKLPGRIPAQFRKTQDNEADQGYIKITTSSVWAPQTYSIPKDFYNKTKAKDENVSDVEIARLFYENKCNAASKNFLIPKM